MRFLAVATCGALGRNTDLFVPDRGLSLEVCYSMYANFSIWGAYVGGGIPMGRMSSQDKSVSARVLV